MRKKYVGTKIIEAEKMKRGIYQCQTNPLSKGMREISNQEGYKIYYPPFKSGEDCYVSWSPKEIFESCYREILQTKQECIKKK